MTPPAHDIVLTDFDHRRLRGLLHVLRQRSGVDTWNLDVLEMGLGRARVVRPEVMPPTVVTMNSRVRLVDLDSGVPLTVSLVFPGEPGPADAGVPVLSLLGLTLLGCREGEALEWRTRDRVRRLRVDAVLYQPEAEGDYFV